MIIVTKTKKDKILRYSPVRNKPDLYEEELKTALGHRHKRNLKEMERHTVFLDRYIQQHIYDVSFLCVNPSR